MKRLALFLVFVKFLVEGVSSTCPLEDRVYPCECTDEDEGYIEIECSGREVTLGDLQNALSAVDKDEEVLLVLEEMSLGDLPSDFFRGYKIIKIEMDDCEFQSLAYDGGRPFTGLENVLAELDIHKSISADNNIITLDLSHLKYLTDLDLTGNQLLQLDNDWFSQGPSLIRLVLKNNGFEKIGDRVFGNLPRIEILSLEGNRFSTPIVKQMFPNPANKLEELELNNNAITSIPEDLFANMPSLKKLSLYGNGIVRIDQRTFEHIWHRLEVIDLRKNPLECDAHINWLLKVKKPAYVLGKCQLPAEKRDTDLDDLIV